MDELLRKLATEGWWAWVILLFVVTIAYLARHRVGFAALVRRWEEWESDDEVKPHLVPGEDLRLRDGPVAVTNKRFLVRKKQYGLAFSQGKLDQICNVDYSETWPLPAFVFGAIYFVLGGLAIILSGGAIALIILGALIAAAGLLIFLAPVLMRPASLIITFNSGRPIIITGRWDEERFKSLLKALKSEK